MSEDMTILQRLQLSPNPLARDASVEIERLHRVIEGYVEKHTERVRSLNEAIERANARRAAQIVYTKRWRADAKSLRMVLRILLGEQFANDMHITYGWQYYDAERDCWVDHPVCDFSEDREYKQRFPVHVNEGTKIRLVRRTAVDEEVE